MNITHKQGQHGPLTRVHTRPSCVLPWRGYEGSVVEGGGDSADHEYEQTGSGGGRKHVGGSGPILCMIM